MKRYYVENNVVYVTVKALELTADERAEIEMLSGIAKTLPVFLDNAEVEKILKQELKAAKEERKKEIAEKQAAKEKKVQRVGKLNKAFIESFLKADEKALKRFDDECNTQAIDEETNTGKTKIDNDGIVVPVNKGFVGGLQWFKKSYPIEFTKETIAEIKDKTNRSLFEKKCKEIEEDTKITDKVTAKRKSYWYYRFK